MPTRKRCVRCNLPHTFPGLHFSKDQVCNFCVEPAQSEKPYWGEEKLREDIQAVLDAPEHQDRRYDAAVAFSGGRDSTFLLYYAKEVLKLHVLAISLCHDFVPKETLQRGQKLCDSLGVELKYIENKALNTYSRKLVRAWSHKPNAPMLLTFCTGCRYGIQTLIPEYCRKEGIPILLVGNNRMEMMRYRQDILATDPANPTAKSKILGYAKHIAKNPRLLVSPKCMALQAREFRQTRRKPSTSPVLFAPMRDYFYLPEEALIARIKALGWGHDPNFRSTWRADCYVNVLRQYYYQRLLGFTDQDVQYAQRIRAGSITKEEALGALQKESHFDPEFLKFILQDFYSLDYNEIENRISKP